MSKYMQFNLPEGGMVNMEWPDSITVESLEMVEEMLTIQLRSIRRETERKRIERDASVDAWMAANGYDWSQP